MTMTGKLKQQLIFGLLAWGLFASLPNTAHAQKWLGTAGSVQNGLLGDTVGAQMIRAGEQEAVDQAAAIAGYKSENIKAVSFQDAKDLAAKGSGLNNVSGAANAQLHGTRDQTVSFPAYGMLSAVPLRTYSDPRMKSLPTSSNTEMPKRQPI